MVQAYSYNYVRSNIEEVEIVPTSTINGIHITTIITGDTSITNIYKPPNSSWPAEILPINVYPAINAGDFNSHHTQ